MVKSYLSFNTFVNEVWKPVSKHLYAVGTDKLGARYQEYIKAPHLGLGAGSPTTQVDRKTLVKQVARKFFGKSPYSTAHIDGGKVHRQSFGVMGLGADGRSYRYGSMKDIHPTDKKKLADLRNEFLKSAHSAGVEPGKVDMKFHMGAGIYASVRTHLDKPVDKSNSPQVKSSRQRRRYNKVKALY